MTNTVEKKQNTFLLIKLIKAIDGGNVSEVERLIPASDPELFDSEALFWAASYGHTDIVKLLIPVSDPKATNSGALRIAANHGHTECVKLLIPVSDPKALNSEALQWAAKIRHIEIVKLLIPVSDYKKTLKCMLDDNEDITLIQQCIDEYEALQQKHRLTNVINDTSHSTVLKSVTRKI